jgi:hypothetical protein
MAVTEFNQRVAQLLNETIPALEKSLGREATSAERFQCVKSAREALGEKPVPGTTPPASTTAIREIKPEHAAAFSEECRGMVASVERRLGRELTSEEGAQVVQHVLSEFKPRPLAEDLAKEPITEFRERLAAHFVGGASPGLRPIALSAEAEAAKHRVAGLSDQPSRDLAKLTSEEYHQRMEAFARIVPFGAERLDRK